MEMDELLERIDKARLHALEEARKHNTQSRISGPEDGLAHAISASAEISVARALDTILGLNTPAPLVDGA